MDYIKVKKHKIFNLFSGENFYTRYTVFVLLYLLAINNMANSFLSIIAVALALPFLLAPEEGIPLLFICALNDRYMVAFQGISMGRIYTMIFIFGALYKIIKTGVKIDYRQLLVSLSFCVFIFFSSYLSDTGEIEPAMTFILNVIMAFMMSYMCTSHKKLVDCLFNLTAVLTVFYFYLLVIKGTDVGDNRISIDSAVNPNNLAMSLVQMIAFLFAYFFLIKNNRKKVIVFITAVLNVISLFYTGARSGVFGIVVGLSLCLILITFSKNKNVKGLNPILIVIMIAAMIGVYIFVSTFNSGEMGRFSFDDVRESGGTGRFDVWRVIVTELFPKMPFFGIGWGGKNVAFFVKRYLGVVHGSHNIFFGILAQTGLAGVLIFFSYMFYIVSKFAKHYKHNAFILIPFTMVCSCIANGIGEDTFGFRMMWFAFGLGLLICHDESEQEGYQIEEKKEIKKSEYIK